MRIARGDLIASTTIAFFITVLVGLVYNVSFDGAWPILASVGILSFLFSAYLVQNQRKNLRKWEKHAVTFPNPEGG